MKAHVIQDGVVVNTIIVDGLSVLPNLIDASIGGKVGDLWDGATFTTPEVSVDELASLQRRIDILEAKEEEGGGFDYTIEQLDTWLDSLFDSTGFNDAGTIIDGWTDADLTVEGRADLKHIFWELRVLLRSVKRVIRKIAIELIENQ